jgi:mycothiol synthase
MRFEHRQATEADASAAAELVTACDRAQFDEADMLSEKDVLDWWRRAVDGGVVAVVDDGGRLVGLCSIRERGAQYWADGFVHPELRGQGIGSFLVEWAERAASEAGMEAVRVAVPAPDRRAKELLERRDFRYLRSFYRMVIDLDRPPEPPRWPEGFSVARYEPGEEYVLYEVLEDAFADHWEHEPRTFEQWSEHVNIERDLCFLVRADDGSVAAAEICQEQRFGAGWIGVIGVRRPWRRHGLGEALVRLAFQELYRLGRRRVGLGVDAENTSGATRLYERVGMRVAAQEDVYERRL